MYEEILNDTSCRAMLSTCPLFCGLEEPALQSALTFFEASLNLYKKGDFLQEILSPFRHFGLVLDGTVQVYADDVTGTPIIMANVSAGETFGESLCFLEEESPVYIRATASAAVLMLSTGNLHRQPDNPLSLRFTKMLAQRTLTMNDRIQVLSKRTLREKVLTLLNQYCTRFGHRGFTLPMGRADMAVYLGTDRAALSRELSRMQKEGLISFRKNYFLLKI